jgi:opacity protein-like surface antigen
MGDSWEDRVGLNLRGGMKRWLLAGALAYAMAGQALASDLPPPAAAPPPRTPAAYVPPVSPVYNWGGIYFGFNVGYGFGKSNWIDADDPGGETGNFNLRGFLAGPLIGFNFQIDSFVLSAEADFDGSLIDGKISSPFCSADATQCEVSGFRRYAHGWVMRSIGCFSTARAVGHSATSRRALAAPFSTISKQAGPLARASKRRLPTTWPQDSNIYI